MHFRTHNRKRWAHIELVRSILEFGEKREKEEESGDDVNGNGGLVLLEEFPDAAVYAGVEDGDVEAVHLFANCRSKIEHGLVRGHVEVKHFYYILAARGGLDVFCGCLAFFKGAHGEDDC